MKEKFEHEKGPIWDTVQMYTSADIAPSLLQVTNTVNQYFPMGNIVS